MSSELPTHECDLIMKGGITSGIVYPKAIARLSGHYRLRCIGGASAGAIAAACAAAAELGRQRGKPDSFAAVDAIPALLAAKQGDKPLLQRLFNPEPATRPYLDGLLAGLAPDARRAGTGKRWTTAALRWTLALARQFPITAALAVAAVVLLATVFYQGSSAGWLKALAVLCGVLLAVLITVLTLLLRALLGGLRQLRRNGLGLVSGMGDRNQSGPGDQEALTPWLYLQLQQLAGQASDKPLTFADLWGSADAPQHERSIDLRLMTTLISQRRGLCFPLEDHETFYFSAAELRHLFGEPVVQHMIDRARAPSEHTPAAQAFDSWLLANGYHRLPLMADLPIIVAVRMSLAFPVLLAPVPLHTRAFKDAAKPLQRVWFADGGIISNFPIHFFDALIPSRPTFGINLGKAAAGETLETAADFVRLDRDNSVDPPRTDDLDPGRHGIGRLLGFVFATLHNWSDEGQMRSPGFRDRIVHIKLREDEGGLNLRMSDALITDIAQRGAAAGDRLLLHFHPDFAAARAAAKPDIKTGWSNHRWVRYRVAAQLLERALLALLASDRKAAEGLDDLRPMHAAPPSYPFANQTDSNLASTAYDKLLELADWFDQLQHAHDETVYDSGNVPKPRSQLRIMPRV